jgi:hypothetical protein
MKKLVVARFSLLVQAFLQLPLNLNRIDSMRQQE